MKADLFGYSDYKKYLEDWIHTQPHHGRGARSSLARAAGCQSAYISQVLNGDLNLSLEQAHSINMLLGHGPDEGHFFLLLVQNERAGSSNLKKYFQDQLGQLAKKQFFLKHRLGEEPHLVGEDQTIYYSSWIYAAVHVLVDIPEFQTKEALAKRLSLPLQRIADVLEFLVGTGLVLREGNLFRTGKKSIHLGSDSPLIYKHHANWRMRAISALDAKDEEALHYSSAITISYKDVPEIKSILVNTIKEIKARVRHTKEETPYCFSLDFFGL